MAGMRINNRNSAPAVSPQGFVRSPHFLFPNWSTQNGPHEYKVDHMRFFDRFLCQTRPWHWLEKKI